MSFSPAGPKADHARPRSGFDVLTPFVTHMQGKITAEDRQSALAGYADRLRSLEFVPRLFFHPADHYSATEQLRPGVKARSGFQHN